MNAPRGKKRDSSTQEYEVKYKQSTRGVQGVQGVQGGYREYRRSEGSTGGVQEEYEGSIRGVRTPGVALFSPWSALRNTSTSESD